MSGKNVSSVPKTCMGHTYANFFNLTFVSESGSTYCTSYFNMVKMVDFILSEFCTLANLATLP